MNSSGKGSNLILDICKKLDAKKYISGPGGKNYLDENQFNVNDIEINYLENLLPSQYPQMYKNSGFINDLSALDFILNVGADWRQYLIL